MNTSIVSNRDRLTLDISTSTKHKVYYVYIPLNSEEKELFARNINYPCWRIEVVTSIKGEII